MCGIFGTVSSDPCARILINGLKRLEYRGYDSAGYVVVDDGLHLHKTKGSVSNLKSSATGSCGIAHTRWATHGEPSARNAHPHLDSSGQLAIVHNGIIENHDDLRCLLKRDGILCSSDTDSELIAHLLAKNFTSSLLDAMRKTLPMLQGAYAILAVSSQEPDTIVAAKKGSPLVIGVADGARFIASDVGAFVNHTRSVIYLGDDELCVLHKDSHIILTSNGDGRSAELTQIDWDVEAHSKAGYDHFMLKEIFEQPRAVRDALAGRLRKVLTSASLNSISLPKDFDRIVITACGTSWHAGLVAKHYIESLCRIPVEVDYASELRYRDPFIDARTVVIAISQSGETADTLEALRVCREKGAYTIGVVNVVGSSIARTVDAGLYVHAGPEIGVASTKAFTTQLMTLLILAVDIAYRKGTISRSFVDDLQSACDDLPAAIEDVLSQHTQIKRIASLFSNTQNALFMGRGMHFPVALEGALKLKEISYVHAEGLPAAEMKHGPIALIDEQMPVVVCAPDDELFPKLLSNVQEVKARKAITLVVTDSANPVLDEVSDYLMRVPKVHSLLRPIISSIPLQLLAYEVAVLKGHSPDKPRNLAKAVTVE